MKTPQRLYHWTCRVCWEGFEYSRERKGQYYIKSNCNAHSNQYKKALHALFSPKPSG